MLATNETWLLNTISQQWAKLPMVDVLSNRMVCDESKLQELITAIIDFMPSVLYTAFDRPLPLIDITIAFVEPAPAEPKPA